MKEKVKHSIAEKASSLTETVEHPSSPEGEGLSLSSLLHSADTWITLAFVVFIFLALRYIKPAITASLDDRSAKIREQLEQAARLRAEAETLLSTYRQQQEQLQKEAELILENAKKEAASMRTQAEEDLKASLARRAQQAEEKVARAEAEAVAKIRSQIVDLALEKATTALKNNSETTDTTAIQKAIASITALSA